MDSGLVWRAAASPGEGSRRSNETEYEQTDADAAGVHYFMNWWMVFISSETLALPFWERIASETHESM